MQLLFIRENIACWEALHAVQFVPNIFPCDFTLQFLYELNVTG